MKFILKQNVNVVPLSNHLAEVNHILERVAKIVFEITIKSTAESSCVDRTQNKDTPHLLDLRLHVACMSWENELLIL